MSAHILLLDNVMIKLASITLHMLVLYLTLIVRLGCINAHTTIRRVLIKPATITMTMFSNLIMQIVQIGFLCAPQILVQQAANQKPAQITLYPLSLQLPVKDGLNIVKLMRVGRPVKTLGIAHQTYPLIHTSLVKDITINAQTMVVHLVNTRHALIPISSHSITNSVIHI